MLDRPEKPETTKPETLETASPETILGGIAPQAPQPASQITSMSATPLTEAEQTPPARLYASPLEEAEHLSHDLKRLMSGVENASLKTEVKDHIERLNRWADTYCQGLNAAQKISDRGIGGLQEAQKELSLALEEYLRLEDEGGMTATPEQCRKTDELASALKRINKLIPAIEHSFGSEASPATGIASSIKPS